MSSENIKISVIIPTYNRSKLLNRSIRSVLNQTYQPNEIIVVDNGSSDDTREMVSKNFKKICYIYHDKKGVSSARNAGIRISKNNWISFLDSDDEWIKDKLFLQKEYILKNPDVDFLHTNEIWFKNGKHFNQKKIHKKYGGYIFKNCLKLCCISLFTTNIEYLQDLIPRPCVGLFTNIPIPCANTPSPSGSVLTFFIPMSLIHALITKLSLTDVQ